MCRNALQRSYSLTRHPVDALLLFRLHIDLVFTYRKKTGLSLEKKNRELGKALCKLTWITRDIWVSVISLSFVINARAARMLSIECHLVRY